MNVSDVFEQLTHGELRQMAFGGSEASGIIASDYPRVIPHINLGLNEIYKRFPIRHKSLNIQMVAQIQEYFLLPKYAQTNTQSLEPVKYIIDTEFAPFTDGDEVLKIEEVFNEKGETLFKNDDTNPWSVFTPSHNSVQVPYNDENNAITVQYRAGHPKLLSVSKNGEDILAQEVLISSTYLQSLLLFIGARYLSTRGNNESAAEGAGFMAKFERSIDDINLLNLTTEENNTNLKLEEKGWV